MGWSQENYIRAFRLAAEAHGNQKVPGTEISYLFHVSLVAMEMLGALNHHRGLDEDLAVSCSLLHDVVEDTDITGEEIQEKFDTKTADGVLALTKDHSLPKEKRMPDSLKRILKQPVEIWMVKMADRITNLQKPPDFWSEDKKAAYLDDSFLIHEKLKGGSDYLSRRLIEKIDNYKKYLDLPG